MDPFAILPPELHKSVVQHLDCKTVVACALVNRCWYKQFGPSVWETVAIATPIQFEAFEASVNSGALSRHGHLIRSLKTEIYEVVEMLLARGATTCTKLALVDVTFKRLRKSSANAPIYVTVLPLVCLLDNNPGLKSVTLHGNTLRMHLPLSQIVSALPVGVEHLKLDGNTGWPMVDYDENSAGVYEQDIAIITRKSSDCSRKDLPTLGLRKMELFGSIQGEALVPETLKRSPVLESFVFDKASLYLYMNGEEELPDILRKHCPALTSLYMDPGFVDDGFLSQLVDEASTQGWKHLAFSGEGFGPLTEAAIMKHVGSLESIHLNIGLGFPSSSIQRLFCSAPNLKSFRGGRPSFVYADVQLDATDMIQSPWVCHSLEELQLCISGVPRPDLTARTNGRPLWGPMHEGIPMESSYAVQRQVYAQLGKLTKLRELVLSVSLKSAREQYGEDLSDFEYDTEDEYHDPNLPQAERQYECLSFTLESGLDLLRDLKDLRVIDLSNMAVGIGGEAEQQWVKEHWPLVRQA
ncbi:hypothetical protein BGZ70_006465 [Mortierella alpina]|uniref:F-box domain-containing protein n=1 Tax=Mortierella alpina TaxID=64518 RepID=A0A9P6J7M6_MORAP|nr:hypothetical protein BGZ70_006465 [Mortierella alpina]